MGCLQRLGHPQRRGDSAIVGRNADEHATGRRHTHAQPDAAEEAQAAEKQRLNRVP